MKTSYDAYCCVLLSRLFYEKQLGKLTVLHIGGYDGTWDLFLREAMAGIPLKIYSVEPYPPNFSVMQKNFKGSTDIEALNYAVGCCNGKGVIYGLQDQVDQGASYMEEEDKPFSRRYEARYIMLSTLCGVHHIEKVDLLRINCEGGELDIFRPDMDLSILDRTSIIHLCLHGKATRLENKHAMILKQKITKTICRHGFIVEKGNALTDIMNVPKGHNWQVYVRKSLFGKGSL